MRITILSCVLLLFTPTVFAASRLPQSASGSEESKPPKTLYSKGKGTIGLVSALVLGPVGWLGVRALSRNKKQRTKATQGLKIWGEVVLTAALIWLMVLGAKSGNAPSFNFGGGSSSPQHKDKKDPKVEAIPLPPIHVPELSSPKPAQLRWSAGAI